MGPDANLKAPASPADNRRMSDEKNLQAIADSAKFVKHFLMLLIVLAAIAAITAGAVAYQHSQARTQECYDTYGDVDCG